MLALSGPAPQKVISPGDPSSASTAKAQRTGAVRLGLNYRIDICNTIVVDAKATPARICEEVAATKVTIKRAGQGRGR